MFKRFRTFPCDRQLDMMDCGPACLKMIAKYYGKFYSLQYLRELCGNTREGVSLNGLSYGAEAIGLRSIAVKCTVDDLFIKIPLPIVVHWEDNHFVVVYCTKFRKNKKGKIFVSDPARGLISYSIEEFESKWLSKNDKYRKGVALLLEPTVDFQKIDSGKRNRAKKTFESLIAYFSPYKRSFLNLIVVMLLITFLQAALPFISKAIIDVGIQTRDLNFINLILLANLAILVSTTLSTVVRDWILMHITARVNLALISDYLVKLLKLPVSFFENRVMGDILQRAQDHERIRNFFMNSSLNLIFSAITFFLFGIILLLYNINIFLFFIIGSVTYVIWVISFLKIREKLDWEYFELNSSNQSYWVETISGIQDIKINNYEKAKRWKWENIQARLYKVNIRAININNMQTLGGQFIDQAKNIFITFYCAKMVISGEITFGVMISVQFIMGMLTAPVQQFISFIISFQVAKISFLRLNEIHQLQDEGEEIGQNNIELPKNKDIVLNNVSFQYSQASPLVIKGITLIIPEGKVTAIVGDSGCGKSTLLKLLLRLYKPSFGEIMIGDMNINNVSLFQWREKFGAVLQDGRIFNDTILNNIILDDDNPDYKKLRQAVETANISREIEQLPLGYQTKMGENGRGLSGGQKQRILIARALYKDPDYLFFDEATNSLDSINEKKIVTALNGVFQKKTVVVIAHRLSTIRNADQIIVMHNGAISEIGKHEVLIAKQGKYYNLIRNQNENLFVTQD